MPEFPATPEERQQRLQEMFSTPSANPDKYAKLPLYAGHGHDVVGYAWVDTVLLPWLTKLGPWYPDSYSNRAPRTQVTCVDPVKRRYYQVVLRLHRVVRVLDHLPLQELALMCSSKEGIKELINRHNQLPRLRFQNLDVLDCTSDNILSTMTNKSAIIREDKTGISGLYSPGHQFEQVVQEAHKKLGLEQPTVDPALIDQTSAERDPRTGLEEIADMVTSEAEKPRMSMEDIIKLSITGIDPTQQTQPETSPELLSADPLSAMANDMEQANRVEELERQRQNIAGKVVEP